MKIADMLVKIQKLADEKLADRYNIDGHFSSVGTCCCYDRMKNWQVWVDIIDANGDISHKVLFENSDSFIDTNTLSNSLKAVLKWLKENDIILEKVYPSDQDLYSDGKLNMP